MTNRDPQPITHGQVLARLCETETQLEAMRQALEQSDRLASIGLLTAAYAHEISNCLSPAVAASELMGIFDLNSDMSETPLAAALASLQQAAALSSDLIDATTKPAQPQPTLLRKTIEEAVAGLQPMPKYHGITVEQRIPADLLVLIEPEALARIVINLVQNACRILRSQPAGRPRRIVVSCESAPDGLIGLVISDTGPGLPPEILRQFRISGSAHNSSTLPPNPSHSFRITKDENSRQKQGANGVGLILSQRLVERSGGELLVAHSSHKGTSFVARLLTADGSCNGR